MQSPMINHSGTASSPQLTGKLTPLFSVALIYWGFLDVHRMLVIGNLTCFFYGISPSWSWSWSWSRSRSRASFDKWLHSNRKPPVSFLSTCSDSALAEQWKSFFIDKDTRKFNCLQPNGTLNLPSENSGILYPQYALLTYGNMPV